jgi:BRCA1 C Terminus (BRCT) domain
MPTAAGRIADRRVDEFIGLCRSLAAKPFLAPADVHILEEWLEQNDPMANYELIEEIVEAVEEAAMDDSEIPALHEILRAFVGGSDLRNPLPTSLPLTNPLPSLSFSGQRFCFSGTFEFGTRTDCYKAVVVLGATVDAVISASTNVLVIGSKVTPSWKHSSYGNKILQAVTWNVPIVSEDHWRDELRRYSALGPSGPSGPAVGPSGPAVGLPANPSTGSGTSDPAPPSGSGPSRSSLGHVEQNASTAPSSDRLAANTIGNSLFWRSPIPHRAGTKARQAALAKFARVYTDFSEGRIGADERDALLDRLVPKSVAKAAAPNDFASELQAIIETTPDGGSWTGPAWKDAHTGEGQAGPDISIAPMAEAAGRTVARLRRMPWYVLPIVVFVLTFWAVAASVYNSSVAHTPQSAHTASP